MLRSHKLTIISLFVLVLLASILRLTNLGYSEYVGDEHEAFFILKNSPTWDFLMSQRKGPMQFVVSYIPYLVTHTFNNQFAERLPFALCSIASVIIFFLFVQKLTKNRTVAFLASFLYLVNGFIVGFGRIAQYQNLNLLFSFLSLYFYADLLDRNSEASPLSFGNEVLKSSLLGTLFFSLSFLAHWDAVFILPVISYFWLNYLLNKGVVYKEKLRFLVFNFIFGCLLILPFLIPYIINFSSSNSNQTYFEKRISLGSVPLELFKLTFELYNPFVTLWFLLAAGLLGALFYKKTWLYTIWFALDFLFFLFFFTKPGTHIYNFLIPVFILSGYFLYYLIKPFTKYFKVLPIAALIIIFTFFYYQSYAIFVDHTVEYPWRQKQIYKWLTPKYTGYLLDQRMPLFGFPHYRYWDKVNEFVNAQNKLNRESYGYLTNEDKSVSEWYMDADYRDDTKFYYVSVKDPAFWVENWSGVGFGGRTLVQTFGDNGETMVKVYKSKR